MKAYLMEVSLITRIVVPDDFDLEEFHENGKDASVVIEAARPRLVDKVRLEIGENIAELYEDLEVPYDPEVDGDRFCENCVNITDYITDEGTSKYCREFAHVLGKHDWTGCAKHRKKGGEECTQTNNGEDQENTEGGE